MGVVGVFFFEKEKDEMNQSGLPDLLFTEIHIRIKLLLYDALLVRFTKMLVRNINTCQGVVLCCVRLRLLQFASSRFHCIRSEVNLHDPAG